MCHDSGSIPAILYHPQGFGTYDFPLAKRGTCLIRLDLHTSQNLFYTEGVQSWFLHCIL